MGEYTGLELHREGHVAEVRLCRPELLNRIDLPLHGELIRAFGELAHDPEVRAVVFSSTGKFFSAGGDTAIMLKASQDHAARMELLDEGRALLRAVADFPKPLVVALQGNSYGLGTTLILCADAIVSAPTVAFSDPHVVMALVAGDGGAVAWPTNFGMIQAKRHLLTGDPMSAETAYRLGAVTDLVDTVEDVLPAAHALAARIAALPPLAVQLTKRTLNKAMMARAEEVIDLGFYLEGVTFVSHDLLEAVAAFKEKRPGEWRGA